jgi:hypothetical protein
VSLSSEHIVRSTQVTIRGLKAGEELEILNPNIGESWSLARKLSGDMGLVPSDSYVVSHRLRPSYFHLNPHADDAGFYDFPFFPDFPDQRFLTAVRRRTYTNAVHRRKHSHLFIQ